LRIAHPLLYHLLGFPTSLLAWILPPRTVVVNGDWGVISWYRGSTAILASLRGVPTAVVGVNGGYVGGFILYGLYGQS